MESETHYDVLEARRDIVDFLRKELIGPLNGIDEILDESPYERYSAGILYPQEADTEIITAGENQDLTGVTGPSDKKTANEEQGDDPVYLSNQYLPASLGISFYLVGDPGIQVEIKAGQYESQPGKSGKERYFRKQLSTSDVSQLVLSPGSRFPSIEKKPVLDGKATIIVLWRLGSDGWLVTVSLVNTARMSKGKKIPAALCLHQVEMTCHTVGRGFIAAYPHIHLMTDDNEEHIMDLLYRHHQAYGIGHGCSVKWEEPVNGNVNWIASEFLPTSVIPDITYELDINFDTVLSLHFLSNGERNKKLFIEELNKFVNAYTGWIKNLRVQDPVSADIPGDLIPQRNVLLARLDIAASRMMSGVELLKNNPVVLHAFCLANRAMLMQYIHSKDDLAGRKHPVRNDVVPFPDLEKHQERTWRPFQLAYQLLTLASVAYAEDPDRDVVDLIWFPTGGGKTEAYLSVAAFLLFYRRLTAGKSGGGTAIIMRYTLRLLTAQQFERASTLLCACELIRRDCPDELGEEDISIGLWVGSETTPNTYQDAFDKFTELKDKSYIESPFQIDRCPWCGTELIPSRYLSVEEKYGFVATTHSFFVRCPSPRCPFHGEIPVRVIDDQIYNRPPTLLLATIDKFARMTWVEQAESIFGGNRYRPPELIIQDELHLINGPLGTIAGVYEIAIDALCSRKKTPPKIISSTATIRRADEQVKGLYNRNLQLFPPSGLEASDSYFARYDKNKPGRLYLGFMAQGHTGSTAMIRLSASLLQATLELKLAGEPEDAFWTLVAYHNSLRELGKTLNFAADDIPARIKVISSDEDNLRDISGLRTEELKSNIPAGRLKEILNRLKYKPGEPDSISFLVCTNMFSVGVDVQRLGLMLINGQPKSTSEYIQASSRVGRKYPGIIATLLSPTKPRDRSHFEHFPGFHQALYRYVEPGSVTPFSPPALDRALHAVLVSVVRHGLGLCENNAARAFRSDLENLDWLIDFIHKRVEDIDSQESDATRARINAFIQEWEYLAQDSTHLFYDHSHRAFRSLIRTAGTDSKPGWDTLHSMRNVDKSCVVQIKRKPRVHE